MKPALQAALKSTITDQEKINADKVADARAAMRKSEKAARKEIKERIEAIILVDFSLLENWICFDS